MKIETSKCFAKGRAFAQYRQPTQASLKSFQTDFLEQSIVIDHTVSPFSIVILDILWIIASPPTAEDSIRTFEQDLIFGF